MASNAAWLIAMRIMIPRLLSAAREHRLEALAYQGRRGFSPSLWMVVQELQCDSDRLSAQSARVAWTDQA